MRLTLDNFCSFLAFHPLKTDTKKGKAIAVVATVALGVFTLGLFHAECAIKRCFTHAPTKNPKVAKIAAKILQDHPGLPPLELTRFQGSEEALKEKLAEELAKVQPLDKKLGPPKEHSWRASKSAERETNEMYTEFAQASPNHVDMKLRILPIGSFSSSQKALVVITADYLKVVNNLPNTVDANLSNMEELKQQFYKKHHARIENKSKVTGVHFRWKNINENFHKMKNNHSQYWSEGVLDLIREVIKDSEMVTGLTTEDLFSQDAQNFVFGSAQPLVGVWSISRFGDPDKSEASFSKALKRTMTISAHEMGHMLFLPHCTDYECNMGGYNHRDELDERPLLFCSQDSAKICLTTQTTLKSYYENLLAYFEGFNKRYSLKMDFSYEIGELKKRLEALKP
jgi:archaemetzincin